MTLPMEREQLCRIIEQWNENRLDLFNLSLPNENLEFHGVMRFYFQEPGEKVATKCIRVSNSATTDEVVDALVEKFHPDMKMLSNGKYSIWEVHENGDERQLGGEERPLVVQLSWHKDDREGRFLFRRNDQTKHTPLSVLQLDQNGDLYRSNKRFSKREKKELRKKYQKELLEAEEKAKKEEEIAKRLYSEVPQNTFTRTISNPEIVMKKRREKKIENKLRDMGHGGVLKIYGMKLFPDRPYVAILVEVNHTAHDLVREALDKYGLENAETDHYVLSQVLLPFAQSNLSRSLSDLRSIESKSRFLHDNEYPLRCFLGLSPDDAANTIFILQRRPSNFPPVPRPRKTSVSSMSTLRDQTDRERTWTDSAYQYPSGQNTPTMATQPSFPIEPCLVPIGQSGHEVLANAISLPPGVTEIGTDPNVKGIQLRGASIYPRHCLLSFVDGRVVTITPLHPSASVILDGRPVTQTVALHESALLRIGNAYTFRFYMGTNQNNRGGGNVARTENLSKGRQTVSHIPSSRSYPAELQSHTSLPPKSQTTHFGAQNDSVVGAVSSNSSTETLGSTNMTLPALLEVPEAHEDNFLRFVVLDTHPERFEFRPTPVFTLYMACRHRLNVELSRHILPERSHLRVFVIKVVERCYHVIHLNPSNRELLAYWLTNLSEFLNICAADRQLSTICQGETFSRLHETVHKCFDLLVESMRVTIQSTLPSFLNYSYDDKDATRALLDVLSDNLRLIRRNRINPTLTVQVFTHLFHFVNMYVFNWLVSTREGLTHLSRPFAVRLRERLAHINQWAELNGLEMAAECHLDRIQQAVNLMITPKTIDQIASLGATCYKLNGIQVRYLLENFISEYGEPGVSQELINHVVELAENQADVIDMQEGKRIQLEESQQLRIPFRVPEDGYVVETLRGIPAEMSDFISSLHSRGICRFLPQLGASGSWTVHMAVAALGASRQHVVSQSNINGRTSDDYSQMGERRGSSATLQSANFHHTQRAQPSPRVIGVSLYRPEGAGIGLSIVAAQAAGDRNVGIYVKKVVEGSPAQRDGRLETGDQLVSVNGQSLVGITQEEAAQKMAAAGMNVNFEVIKHAAMQNGLESWLRNGLANGTPQLQRQFMGQNGTYQMPANTALHPPEMGQMYRHNRSISASELYSQADTASLASLNSQPPPLYNGHLPQRLPAHYKPAGRPAVLQPGRPASSAVSPAQIRRGDASPTIYHNNPALRQPIQQRSASTVPFGSGTQLSGGIYASQRISGDSLRSPHLRHLPPSSSVTDYHSLPLISEDRLHNIPNENASLNSSTTSSGGCAVGSEHVTSHLPTATRSLTCAMGKDSTRFVAMPNLCSRQNSTSSTSPLPPPPSFPVSRTAVHDSSPSVSSQARVNGQAQRTSGTSALQIASVRPQQFPASGRRSAPLFEDSIRDVEREANRVLTANELHSELDRLDAKEQMTDVEERRYHELLNRLSNQQRPSSFEHQHSEIPTRSAAGTYAERKPMRGEQQLPFMNEMESRLEAKRASVDSTSLNGLMKPTTSSSSSHMETLIDDVTEQVERLNNTPMTPSESERPSTLPATSSSLSSPPKQTSLRESSSPEDKSKQKRVQFADVRDEVKENGTASTSTTTAPLNEEEEGNEPRVQIIGTQEVYNDPRQRRLNEIQAKSLKPVVDGANLGFRDKMKMFAAQLGEQSPKHRYKASSAERDIEA